MGMCTGCLVGLYFRHCVGMVGCWAGESLASYLQNTLDVDVFKSFQVFQSEYVCHRAHPGTRNWATSHGAMALCSYVIQPLLPQLGDLGCY
jgi:hypothetical protein